MNNTFLCIAVIVSVFLIASPIQAVKIIGEEEITTPEIIKKEEPINESKEASVTESNIEHQVKAPEINKSEEKVTVINAANSPQVSKKPVTDKAGQQPKNFFMQINNLLKIAAFLFILKVALGMKIRKFEREEAGKKEEARQRAQQRSEENKQREQKQMEEVRQRAKQRRDKEKQKSEVEKANQRKELINKYGYNDGIRIFNRETWNGMSIEQLTDSIGQPEKIKQRVRSTLYCYGKIIGPRGGELYENLYEIKNGMVNDIRKDEYA